MHHILNQLDESIVFFFLSAYCLLQRETVLALETTALSTMGIAFLVDLNV